MLAHTIFALIQDKEVKNTIICEHYHIADGLAKSTLRHDAFAVEITQIPTAIGHTYENGVFKDTEGNIIEPLPTTQQEVQMLRNENEALQDLQLSQDELVMSLILGDE